jgi:hypothetical protein
VLYARAYTSEQQMELLDFVAAKFHEEPNVFKLLIVDSIMALFRVDFSGRGELAERQQQLAQVKILIKSYGVNLLLTRLFKTFFIFQAWFYILSYSFTNLNIDTC